MCSDCGGDADNQFSLVFGRIIPLPNTMIVLRGTFRKHKGIQGGGVIGKLAL